MLKIQNLKELNERKTIINHDYSQIIGVKNLKFDMKVI